MPFAYARAAVILLWFFLVAPRAAAQHSYDDARRALLAGDYATAAAEASAVVERAPSQATYRLLALAQSRLERPAEAVWAMRSAAALGAPSEDAALADEVYAGLPADLRPLPRRGVSAVAAALTRSPVPQLPAALALLCGGAAAALSLMRVLGARRPSRRTTFAGVVGACSLAGVSLWVALRQNSLAHPAEVVVLAEAPLREAPATNAPLARELPAGAVLAIGERLGDYAAVVLPTGRAGWVPRDLLRPVAPLEPR